LEQGNSQEEQYVDQGWKHEMVGLPGHQEDRTHSMNNNRDRKRQRVSSLKSTLLDRKRKTMAPVVVVVVGSDMFAAGN